jgi:hypothetical protein
MTVEGLAVSLSEAFAAAEAELGGATPSATPEAQPADGTQAEATVEHAATSGQDEHPTTGTSADELLSTLKEETPAAPTIDSPDFWNTEVEVETEEGLKRMSLDELRKGNMMRADYTRKTQDLARERGLVSEAVEFHKAFREDPQGFARFIASKAGLIDDQGVSIDGIQIYTSDQLEAEVEKRLAERLETHPDVAKARTTQAMETVNNMFAELETTYGTISKDNRLAVLREAQRRGTSDIGLVFESMLMRATQLAAARKDVKQAAPAKPGGTPETETAPTGPEGKLTLEQAFKLAEKELSGTAA